MNKHSVGPPDGLIGQDLSKSLGQRHILILIYITPDTSSYEPQDLF